MRRYWVVAALALGACGPPARSAESLLPATMAEVWQRRSLDNVPTAPVGGRRAFEARYEGPGKLTATVYELKYSEQGLDLVQRWKPAPDTVFFSSGKYFVVVKWAQADRKALTAFVRELERGLGGQGKAAR
jgi:hypothetical protein